MDDRTTPARRPRVIVPFWAVIVAVAVILIAIVIFALLNTVAGPGARATSASCTSFARAANGYIKVVESTHAGKTTTTQLTAATKALPGKLRAAASSATGEVRATMTASASAASYYVDHRSSLPATTRLYNSVTDVQHACSTVGASFNVG